MSAAWKWVTSIVGGGIALGALLGMAAQPRLKDPPLQWWQLTGRDAIVAVNDQTFYEPGPAELDVHGGFRPDFDYDAEVWAAPIAAYELAYYRAPEPWTEPDEAEPAAEPLPVAGESAGPTDVGAASQRNALAGETGSDEAPQPALAENGLY